MRISEAFKAYGDNYMSVKCDSVSSRQQYRFAAKHLVQTIGDKKVSDLTLEDIDAWWNELLKARRENTSRNYICKLRSTLRFCRMIGEDCMNPDLIPVPKRRDNNPTFLTPQEVNRLIEAAPNARAKFIISFFYSSGVRLSEFLQLDAHQIRDRQFSVVGKGGKARLCFIDERTENLMGEYLETRVDNNPALLISYKTNDRMSITVLRFIVKNTARRAGITKPVTPHTLRHSFATNFLRNNGNMRYLSKMMGHSSLQTTAHYTHVIDNDLREQYEKFHSC